MKKKMSTTRLDSLFDIKNGLAISSANVLAKRDDNCIPYIRPANTQQRTIAGWVKRNTVRNKHVFPSETIFVSTNGEGSHTYAYVSQFDFIPNIDVAILVPKRVMTIQEKIFYARCITMNRYRFSYGRKPKGERLKPMELPDTVPDWVKMSNTYDVNKGILEALKKESTTDAPLSAPDSISNDVVRVCDIFDVVIGTDLKMVCMTKCPDGINFVSRTAKNNGVVARVAKNGVKPIQGEIISVAGSGSVLESFVQIKPFYSGHDLFVLRPKLPMSIEELFFYATCIRANQSRYNYGRQANRTLKDLRIPARSAIPSWTYGSISKMSDQIAAKLLGSVQNQDVSISAPGIEENDYLFQMAL
jgi:hypothetical protein